MPSTAALLWSILFSSIGLAYLVYGRRQKNKVVFYTGIGLIVYPYFVANVVVLVAIGLVLMLVPRFVKL